MVNILLHVCCAPCAIYPVEVLREHGFTVTAYFYNPNIHPFQEYRKRLDSIKFFCEKYNLPLIIEGHYQLSEFLRTIVFHEQERCSLCSSMRISKTYNYAKSNGFDNFTTSLLYSKYQKHDEIRRQGEEISKNSNISFFYKDFRKGWQHGVDASIAQGLYRQPYCGCIYSEQQRYDKSTRLKGTKCYAENDSSSYNQ